MTSIYYCKNCNIEYQTAAIDFQYCPFCGEKVKHVGMVIGVSKQSEQKWSKAVKILFLFRKSKEK